ncbi:helix-turn-helix transcriptional regulator [Burkholderia pseudomallei]|uniref:helix-turn-helix transcriptional regulator n=1 Tax=Burkholderia pseudomallei TaxID=28450 RepID=UPI0021F6C6D4|nr:AlpA family transcriptional regulator [Burkholderia pseudomallei]MCW0101044.1 AlpA family transcriptional regulator [Burkholderia pseudomallei]
MEQKPKRILRIEDACIKLGMPRSTFYRAVALGELPKPIKLGEKATGWVESELDAFIDARIAARDQK